jgi:hypothetical protein
VELDLSWNFCCGSTPATVCGSVIVPLKANKMSLSATLKFKASKGVQKPERDTLALL